MVNRNGELMPPTNTNKDHHQEQELNSSFNPPSIEQPEAAYHIPPEPESPSILPPTLDLNSIQLIGSEESRNWSTFSKWSTASIISLMGFVAPLGSSIVVPGSGLLDREFHLNSRVLSLLPVSFFILGLGIGPFVLAPISELKGRQPVYIGSSIIFVLFNIATAVAPNEVALYILRFIAGVSGSSGPSLGAGSIVSIIFWIEFDGGGWAERQGRQGRHRLRIPPMILSLFFRGICSL